jgi:hypothetical protein
MIDSDHVTPLSSPKSGERRLWNRTMIPETRLYKGLRIKPMVMPPLSCSEVIALYWFFHLFLLAHSQLHHVTMGCIAQLSMQPLRLLSIRDSGLQ